MKFFIDTANLDQIQEAQALGILDGVTTKPFFNGKRRNYWTSKHYQPLQSNL